MTSSSPSGGLTSLLDAFLVAPIDGITLPSESLLFSRQAKHLSSAFSLLKPTKSNEQLNSFQAVTLKRTTSNQTCSTSAHSTLGTDDNTNSSLEFPSVESTDDGTRLTNAESCRFTVGYLEQDEVSRFIRSTYRSTNVAQFVFPSLSLTQDLKCCLYNGKFFHQDSAIHHSHDVGQLMSRLLVAPLPQLMRLSVALQESTEAPVSTDCYLACAIKKLFNSLIHHRLGFWIAKLKRAVDLEEEDVDTNNKRVLVALLDVQDSMEVDDDVDIAFTVVRDRSHSIINAEMQEIVRMEQELADTLASMKHGSNGFVPGSPLPSFHPAIVRRKNTSDNVAKPKPTLLLPNLLKTDTSASPVPQVVHDISVPIVMDASARVRTQIGEDLEQGHTVGFGVSGSVVGYFIESSESAYEWIGVELKLDTEELYTNMEKQARLVARSTAESVLLNAMTEEKAESDYSSADQEESRASNSSSDHPQASSEDNDSAEESDVSEPVIAGKTLSMPLASPRLIKAAAFSPPISVSPISSPRRHYTPSPLQVESGLPLVSPPPLPGYTLASSDRLSLKPKRLGFMTGSFTLEPASKRSKASSSPTDGIDEDIAGALTALKNAVQC